MLHLAWMRRLLENKLINYPLFLLQFLHYLYYLILLRITYTIVGIFEFQHISTLDLSLLLLILKMKSKIGFLMKI